MSSGNQLPNLDKIFRDEDEPDFVPSGGSNLAAIFGLQAKPLDNHSSSKQQTVKKPPSNSRNLQQSISNKTEVIIAKAVRAFKLQNGAYVPVGNLGMALTGNTATRVYQIILYRTKLDHVSTVTVTHDFLYLVQPNNYSSYYDCNQENWSILFENNDTCLEFSREVALARYFSRNGKIENVLYQDLSPTSNDLMAKEGDNLSLKYFIAPEIVQPFKCNFAASQTMTVEISTDDNWEKTLTGSSKGLKRILFLPPSKQISLGPGFPKEKDVILEIEIIDIQPREVTQSHKVANDKASIISRMAKMGHSMLPKIPVSTTTDSEDTEDDIPHKSPRHRMAHSSEDGHHKKHSSKESLEEAATNTHRLSKSKDDVPVTFAACKPFVSAPTFSQWSPKHTQPNVVTLDGQVYSLQRPNVAPTISSVIDPGMNMLLSETRMTNTELRMGMSKIADNVQKLLDKFHVLELQNATSPVKDQTALDAVLKMFLTMKASQIGETDASLQKTTDVAIVKDSEELSEMRTIVSSLKEKLAESEAALIEKTDRIKNLESQKDSLTKTNESLSTLHTCTLSTLNSLKETNEHLERTKKDLEEVKELNSKYMEEKIVLENRISKLVEQCNSSTSANSVETNDNKNKEIKSIMNKIYHTLMDKFEGESYPTSYIKSTIAATIKNATLQVLYNADKETSEKAVSVAAKVTEAEPPKVTETVTPTLSILPTQPPKQTYVSENITHIITG
ncbi:FK506-binding protein 15 isoform X2 [Halictus rubicundus]|uniref:FK506-binding protein 15 isoform X2 n=1 Tax=Halictus rubicundus TaxID=77578 RepID=UPI0040350559